MGLEIGDRVKVNVENWVILRISKSKGFGTVVGNEGRSIIVKVDDVVREILVGPSDMTEITKLMEK